MALDDTLYPHAFDPKLAAQYFVDWVDQPRRRLVEQPQQDMVVQTTFDLPTEEALCALRERLRRGFTGRLECDSWAVGLTATTDTDAQTQVAQTARLRHRS